MVVKRDFDKVLVNLLRSNPHFLNIALIDAEGIPISFAIKSRKYQVKPATLGSKTKVLLHSSKDLANTVNITEPVIQVYFFKELALLIVNLKIVNFFILIDINGWPADGKLLYQSFVEVKDLLSEVEESKDDTLKALFASEKQDQYKISDLSDNFLKIIAKNINSLNQIQVKPVSINKSSISLEKDDATSYTAYFSTKLINKKIIEGTCFKQTGAELFKVENTHEALKGKIKNFIDSSQKEVEGLNLGEPIWFLNIFEKSEILLMGKLGAISQEDIYCGLLMENRLGNLTEIINLIYLAASEINVIQPSEHLKDLIQVLEFIGFSIDDLNIKIEKTKVTNQTQLTKLFLARAANLLISKSEFSKAGDYYIHLADAHSKEGDNAKAEQILIQSADLQLKVNNSEKAGDAYLRIGMLAQTDGDISKAFEYYNNAVLNYKKGGKSAKVKKIEQKLNEIKSSIKGQLKTYLASATGESIPFSFLQDKFKVSEKALVDIFKMLFEGKEIGGQINLIKKRYTKKKYGTDESIVGESTVVGEAYKLPEINRGDLLKQQKIIETELARYENKFESINFPFEMYLEYQNQLMKLDFIEQKMNIYNKNLDETTCGLCFKRFNKETQITDCGFGHFFHLECMKLWLENQHNCPICDANILSNLKTYFLDTLQAKDDLLSLQDIVKTLKIKINNLEKEVGKKEEQIFLMKEYSEKDKTIFEKLMIERDSKHLVEKELRKSNQLIQELKSLLEIIKK